MHNSSFLVPYKNSLCSKFINTSSFTVVYIRNDILLPTKKREVIVSVFLILSPMKFYAIFGSITEKIQNISCIYFNILFFFLLLLSFCSYFFFNLWILNLIIYIAVLVIIVMLILISKIIQV